MPPAVHWFPHYHWHPIIDMQPTTLDTVVVGNRVYTNGEEEIVVSTPAALSVPLTNSRPATSLPLSYSEHKSTPYR